jgi:hypothetical protein
VGILLEEEVREREKMYCSVPLVTVEEASDDVVD